jgi:hypothetical protein
MKNRLFIGLVLFAVLITAACCKKECQDLADPTCENYDPCFRKITANFKMGSWVEASIGHKYFEMDTCHRLTELTFEALDSSNVTYEWKIGTDPTVFTSRKFRLSFDSPAEIDVRLIVKKKDNCVSGASLTDTLTKRLVIRNTRAKDILTGKYHGYLESNVKDTFDITILNEPFYNSYIDGLPRGCDKHYRGTQFFTEISFGAYKDFEVGEVDFSAGTGLDACTGISGWLNLGKDDTTLIIDFKYYKNLKKANDKFIGKKIK